MNIMINKVQLFQNAMRVKCKPSLKKSRILMKFSSPALHNKLYNFQQRDICTYIWAQKFGTPIVLRKNTVWLPTLLSPSVRFFVVSNKQTMRFNVRSWEGESSRELCHNTFLSMYHKSNISTGLAH